MTSNARRDASLFAFLRAVNLGRNNQVPMAKLIAAMGEDGLPPAAYLLASGNLAMSGTRPSEELRLRLTALIRERFGVDTAVVFRSPEQLAGLLTGDPLTPAGWENVHVSLWDDEPEPAGLARLADEDFGEDTLHLTEGAAYLGYRGGSHASKLNNAVIERRLQVTATARNIKTFRRLLLRFAPSLLESEPD